MRKIPKNPIFKKLKNGTKNDLLMNRMFIFGQCLFKYHIETFHRTRKHKQKIAVPAFGSFSQKMPPKPLPVL